VAGRFGFRNRRASGGGGIIRAGLLVLAVVIVIPYLLVPVYRFVDPVSTLMLWRWATGARVERRWVPLDHIAPALRLAVIAAEDDRFCSHHGVDFTELHGVIGGIEDVNDLAEVRGGSTITQQTAKNLFLWQGHSFVRKALEFPLALWIDFVLPKRRVLEIYLNIAEWGPNGEFGIEAAARRAFNRKAADLNTREAALLAASLPNPHRRDPHAPKPGLRRLAGLYQGRMARSPTIDACVRSGHGRGGGLRALSYVGANPQGRTILGRGRESPLSFDFRAPRNRDTSVHRALPL
jgi:monofunctional biosynthetic peptidoglycan transglycosylase